MPGGSYECTVSEGVSACCRTSHCSACLSASNFCVCVCVSGLTDDAAVPALQGGGGAGDGAVGPGVPRAPSRGQGGAGAACRGGGGAAGQAGAWADPLGHRHHLDNQQKGGGVTETNKYVFMESGSNLENSSGFFAARSGNFFFPCKSRVTQTHTQTHTDTHRHTHTLLGPNPPPPTLIHS